MSKASKPILLRASCCLSRSKSNGSSIASASTYSRKPVMSSRYNWVLSINLLAMRTCSPCNKRRAVVESTLFSSCGCDIIQCTFRPLLKETSAKLSAHSLPLSKSPIASRFRPGGCCLRWASICSSTSTHNDWRLHTS